MGGTPGEVPEEYARRSPLRYAEKIAKWDGDFLLMHGLVDVIVPPGQACDLADAVGGFEAYRFTKAGKVVDELASSVREGELQRSAGSLSPISPSLASPLMYDDAGHVMYGPTLAARGLHEVLRGRSSRRDGESYAESRVASRRDVHAAQRLADRASDLGGLGGLLEPVASTRRPRLSTVRAMPVIFMPPFGSGPKVTSAVTSSDCGLAPASSRAFVRDIA